MLAPLEMCLGAGADEPGEDEVEVEVIGDEDERDDCVVDG